MANSQVISHTKITQIDFARAGEITPAMRIVAEKEGRAPEFIREGVAAGRIAIPANIHHTSLSPEGVGEGGVLASPSAEAGVHPPDLVPGVAGDGDDPTE